MSMKIKEGDQPSLDIVNRKLESFVEIVLKKMVDQAAEIKKLKMRVKALEKQG